MRDPMFQLRPAPDVRETSMCLSYGSALGFSPKAMALVGIGNAEHAGAVVAGDYQPCANLHLDECNGWSSLINLAGCARHAH